MFVIKVHEHDNVAGEMVNWSEWNEVLKGMAIEHWMNA